MNSSVNSLFDAFLATILDIFGNITPEIAVDKFINIVFKVAAAEYTDTAIVPDTAPRIN